MKGRPSPLSRSLVTVAAMTLIGGVAIAASADSALELLWIAALPAAGALLALWQARSAGVESAPQAEAEAADAAPPAEPEPRPSTPKAAPTEPEPAPGDAADVGFDTFSLPPRGDGHADQERLMRTVLGMVPDGVAMTDPVGVLLYLNPAVERRFGHNAMDLIGESIQVLMPELLDPRSEVDLEVQLQTLCEEAEAGATGFGLRADYSTVPLIYTCRLLELGGQERVIWWLHTEEASALHTAGSTPGELDSKQMLERKRAELKWMNDTLRREAREHQRAASEALRATRAKNAFMANMSHELRTPLTAIIGYAEMIAEEADPEMAEDAGQILKAGQHLLTLVDDILDLTRVEAGRLDLNPVRVNVLDLLEEVRAVIAPLAAERGNDLEVSCSPSVTTMEVDPARLRKILFNLLSNACKFTEDGQIHLEVELTRGTNLQAVRFVVRDNGAGIDPAYLPQLFEPFDQADAAPTREHGGVGMGLALTRRLCQLMGGEVSAESVLGVGSSFTVRLPLIAARVPRSRGSLR